jgi:hygromycin-B 7''-O-kinase
VTVTGEVAAIAAGYGLRPGRVRPLPPGVASAVYLLGDDLVLRVPRSAGYAADLRKEAALLPHLLGLRTTRLVAFAEEPVIHLVTTRVPGTDRSEAEVDDRIGRQVGRELAELHRIRADLPQVPADTPAADPFALVDRLRADGWIDAGSARRLTGWFERLGQPSPERVLIHGDIAPQNLLADDAGDLTGIVDWGDAMCADPAAEFAKVRLAQVPALLAGYRDGGAPESDWAARVLWHHLVWALGRISDRVPRPGERHWSAPPAARLIDVLGGLSTDPWRRL